MSALTSLAPAPGGGWIGQWSPGIGDPTVGGWLTVGLYVLAAVLAARVVHARRVDGPRERWFWVGLLVCLVLLGLNKQLDAQSALTELGRIVFRQRGLYEARREVQRIFIEALAVTAVAGGLGLAWLVRGTPRATQLALAGALALISFVVIRAASMHRVDALIGTRWLGLRVNWLLEMGSLLVIAAGAALRRRAPARRR
ncbi:MAG TPA: hypothetical protein PLU22_20140 [Polyangiaceae bacterium]|nr:hypothetical protein [Polyangiaceae bacterium]